MVCLYGLPGLVYTDGSAEYKGEFWVYLREVGIHHQVILAQNPQANRQAERYNQMIKMNLQKFAVKCPAARWRDFLPDIAQGLRLLPVKASGYPSHVLVYKYLPVLPLRGFLRALTK